MKIGQTISRRKLANELGMSFLPVSEALLKLEFEGLLESRPRVGTRVRIPTRQDFRGHYVVREALEVQAAMLFAESATAEERAELLRLAVRVDAMSIEPDSDRIVHLTLHEKLHRRIAECARCPCLSEAIEKTHALALTWLCVPRPPSSDRIPHKHQKLIEALSTGDPNLAAEAMREHVASSMQNAMQRLEPYFRLAKTQADIYTRSPKKK